MRFIYVVWKYCNHFMFFSKAFQHKNSFCERLTTWVFCTNCTYKISVFNKCPSCLVSHVWLCLKIILAYEQSNQYTLSAIIWHILWNFEFSCKFKTTRISDRLVRSDRAVILMNLCIALLFALGVFLVGINRTESRVRPYTSC